MRVWGVCVMDEGTGTDNLTGTRSAGASAAKAGGKGTAKSSWSRSAGALVLSLSLAMGLFIWFKLRVVTGMPRSAYAEPEQADLNVPPPKPSEPEGAEQRVQPRWAPDTDPALLTGAATPEAVPQETR